MAVFEQPKANLEEILKQFKEGFNQAINNSNPLTREDNSKSSYTYSDNTGSVNTVTVDVLTEREKLVEKLVKEGNINIKEAMLLLGKIAEVNVPFQNPVPGQPWVWYNNPDGSGIPVPFTFTTTSAE